MADSTLDNLTGGELTRPGAMDRIYIEDQTTTGIGKAKYLTVEGLLAAVLVYDGEVLAYEDNILIY